MATATFAWRAICSMIRRAQFDSVARPRPLPANSSTGIRNTGQPRTRHCSRKRREDSARLPETNNAVSPGVLRGRPADFRGFSPSRSSRAAKKSAPPAGNTPANNNGVVFKHSGPTAIGPGQQTPLAFALMQNYPNPFNPLTKIKFDIPVRMRRGAFVQLIIYDILSCKVTTLVNEQLQPGTYEVEWNATNYPSGIYFYNLNAKGLDGSNFTSTKKMILLR